MELYLHSPICLQRLVLKHIPSAEIMVTVFRYEDGVILRNLLPLGTALNLYSCMDT
jgi:hypothetical protein